MPRTFAPSKKDTTQPAIEAAFKRAGWSVCDVHAVGLNAPDLFAAKHSITIAVECKSNGLKPSPIQAAWAREWKGRYLTGDDPALLLLQAEAVLELYDDRE